MIKKIILLLGIYSLIACVSIHGNNAEDIKEPIIPEDQEDLSETLIMEIITKDSPPVNRISIQEAFNNKDGACAFRALLGIAETRVGHNLTLDQLNEARRMYYGNTRNINWWVIIRRSDDQIQGANNALEDVINIGLELLGSKERALFIRRISASPDNNIPTGTQATLVRVRAVSTSNFHYLEGDANGTMIYDPLDNLNYWKNRTINRFDAIRFFTPLEPPLNS
ncbi:MAG: hypothetical protein LBC80_02010 [Treponema sp.]|jgi:hypothetical protein|nr:hypothetical protein [Treponema sp.]